ncbi:hypothetical protein PMAYCL1PPCAC_20339, partial [Pristionchus mayeri]
DLESMSIDLAKLRSRDEHKNVDLIIEGQKLRISKDFLAYYSPVFAKMFSGDFSENGQKEVEIKDFVFEEFVYLAEYIYSSRTRLSGRLCSQWQRSLICLINSDSTS